MKGTILYAEYDEGTGVSTVIKATKYGTFKRSVRVHPEDEDIANQYDGCMFAEIKCDIAAYQEKAKFLRERAKGIEHAFNVLSNADAQRADYKLDEMKQEWYDLYHQMDIAYARAEDAFETYTLLRDSYKALVEHNLKTRRKIRKRTAKNSE